MQRVIKATLILSLFLTTNIFAHSGGTDKHGCHAGTKKYHCHGSSASGLIKDEIIVVEKAKQQKIKKTSDK